MLCWSGGGGGGVSFGCCFFSLFLPKNNAVCTFITFRVHFQNAPVCAVKTTLSHVTRERLGQTVSVCLSLTSYFYRSSHLYLSSSLSLSLSLFTALFSELSLLSVSLSFSCQVSPFSPALSLSVRKALTFPGHWRSRCLANYSHHAERICLGTTL